ncbi:MAG: TldD/PmbA family protein [Nitrospiraceae bacterium]|nr:TldD/PmbA family protein [Nitrospiraceae bacterium]
MRIDTEFASLALKEAIGLGAEKAEIFIRVRKGVSAESKGGALEAVKTSRDFGYSVRVIKGSRSGFSYSTRQEDFRDVARDAIGAAAYTEEDPFFTLPSFSGPAEKNIPPTPEIYDRLIEEITPELAFQKALSMERSAMESDGRIKLVRGCTASFNTEEVFIVNSNGVSGGFESTSASAQLMAVAEEGKESQMGWDFMGGCFLSDVRFEQVGRQAAQKALMMLGAGRTSPMKALVVLDSGVAAEFLGVFASMLSAESVQKGKSMLKGRTGQSVIHKNLDIIDDGLLSHALGTRPFDDEGVPAGRKVLIEGGVLKGYMHNSYTAAKDGTKSTGNGLKPSISSPPVVEPLNFFLGAHDGRNFGRDELISRAGKGIYVIEAMGMHTINPVSGEFSVGISGLLIENGKLSRPVKEAIISGNILDLFGKVEAVGNDLRFYGQTGSPSILIGAVDISA